MWCSAVQSKDLGEQLDGLAGQINDIGEAATVWKSLGGFKNISSQRNSKESINTEEELSAQFVRSLA